MSFFSSIQFPFLFNNFKRKKKLAIRREIDEGFQQDFQLKRKNKYDIMITSIVHSYQ